MPRNSLHSHQVESKYQNNNVRLVGYPRRVMQQSPRRMFPLFAHGSNPSPRSNQHNPQLSNRIKGISGEKRTLFRYMYSDHSEQFESIGILTLTQILLGMTFYYVILSGKLIQRLWFGQLRALEVEHLYERSWFSVMDTCLALTIFRDGFDLLFVLRFGTLLFCKTFHWIVADRVDFVCMPYVDGAGNRYVDGIPFSNDLHNDSLSHCRYINVHQRCELYNVDGCYNVNRFRV
jgi:hypothetical protein